MVSKSKVKIENNVKDKKNEVKYRGFVVKPSFLQKAKDMLDVLLQAGYITITSDYRNFDIQLLQELFIFCEDNSLDYRFDGFYFDIFDSKPYQTFRFVKELEEYESNKKQHIRGATNLNKAKLQDFLARIASKIFLARIAKGICMKLDMSKIVDKVRASFKDERLQNKISVGSAIKELGSDDYIKLGEWWSIPTGLPGLGKGRIHIIGGSEDSGKCLGYDTPILMFDGSTKKVQDILPNDKLMGINNSVCTVISTSVGMEEMFEITPNYGNLVWTCNGSHILSLKLSGRDVIVKGKKYKSGDIVNMSVYDYLNLSPKLKPYFLLYTIKVEWPFRDVPIDPYYLGLWLGDGTSSKPGQITTISPEIKNYLKNLAISLNLIYKETEIFNKNNIKSQATSCVLIKKPKIKNNILIPSSVDIFRQLSLENNKHIPQEYLINSREVRLNLLAGLLDTDGHLNSTGKSCFEITQKNKLLIDQINFLARSLGFRTNIKRKLCTIKDKNFSAYYYRLHISGNVSEIPCKLPHKQAIIRNGNRAPDVTGFKITAIGNGKYYGFTLKESPLFLLGDFTVTHNTSACIQVTKAAIDQGFGVIYIETEGKTTEKNFRDWGVDPDNIILIQSSIAEELFELCFSSWDSLKELYPDVPLLIIIDSLGNVISKRDSEIDLTESSSMPGGKGKINRLGLTKLIAKANEDNTTLLVVSYSYDNLGTVGKTIAGGKALHLLSSLTYQTSRKGWLERIEKGVKVRYGAEVVWKLQKNHLNKQNPGLPAINFRITSEGISFVDGIKKLKIKAQDQDLSSDTLEDSSNDLE